MAALQVCHACLSPHMSLTPTPEFYIEEYVNLTKLPWSLGDGTRRALCAACCAALRRVRRLRARCLQAGLILQQLAVKREKNGDDGDVQVLSLSAELRCARAGSVDIPPDYSEEDPATQPSPNREHRGAESADLNTEEYLKSESDYDSPYSGRNVSWTTPLLSAAADGGAARGGEGGEARGGGGGVARGGDGEARCRECGLVCASAKSLRRHVRNAHPDNDTEPPRRYPCPSCDRKFSQKSNMHAHQRTHSGDRPHRCPQCSRRFSLSSNLRRHLRLHAGDKPHCCPDCERRFAQRGQLQSHYRTHSGERPYRCERCDFRAAVSVGLLRHVRRHHQDLLAHPPPHRAA